MHKYFLLTCNASAPDLNPGSQFITHGIRTLIHAADPDAVFYEMSLFEYQAHHWKTLLSVADAVFLCGNPRYDRSDHPHWWISGLWPLFATARDKGILTGDLFGGSASPLPIEPARDDAKKLLSYERNRLTAQAQAQLNCLVTRDKAATYIAHQHKAPVISLPCSTFWAPEFWKITPRPPRWNAITVPALHATPETILAMDALRKHIPNALPTYMIAHCIGEYNTLRETLPDNKDTLLLSDPRSLLCFYSQCSHLITARLHAAIPALAMGCKVFHIAVDSRASALDHFGVSSTPLPAILEGGFEPSFSSMVPDQHPKKDNFIKYFQGTILDKIKK